MSYIYMNKELKFLSMTRIATHTGERLEAEWVDKNNADIFQTKNIKVELKRIDRNYHSDIVSAIKYTPQVKVVKTVEIL